MTYVVWKIDLEPGVRTYLLPKDAQFLSAAFQHGCPRLWFHCESNEAPIIPRRIALVGTGQEFEHGSIAFIATMLTDDQNFVFHVFEAIGP